MKEEMQEALLWLVLNYIFPNHNNHPQNDVLDREVDLQHEIKNSLGGNYNTQNN
jgi:hypothetical protein